MTIQSHTSQTVACPPSVENWIERLIFEVEWQLRAYGMLILVGTQRTVHSPLVHTRSPDIITSLFLFFVFDPTKHAEIHHDDGAAISSNASLAVACGRRTDRLACDNDIGPQRQVHEADQPRAAPDHCYNQNCVECRRRLGRAGVDHPQPRSFCKAIPTNLGSLQMQAPRLESKFFVNNELTSAVTLLNIEYDGFTKPLWGES